MFRLLTILVCVIIPSLTYGSDCSNSVNVTLIEPYVMQRIDGSLYGIEIELWEELARDLNYEGQYEYDIVTLDEKLKRAETGCGLVGLGATSITESRLESVDFTIPFQTAHLSVVTYNKTLTTFGTICVPRFLFFGDCKLFPWLKFVEAAGKLIFFIWLGGLIIRVVDKGISKVHDGSWWSVVTLTTTGYGDIVPTTKLGRVFAGIWMIIGAMYVPSYIGQLSASTVLEKHESAISTVADLSKYRLGIIRGTSTVDFFIDRDIPYVLVDSRDELLEQIRSKELIGGVYDRAPLLYLTKNDKKLKVLPLKFNEQYYSLVLAKDSELKDNININMMKKSNKLLFESLTERYLTQ